jgi:hypothetical protein
MPCSLSATMKSLAELSGFTKNIYTTPHRAQANGLCEGLNKRLIKFLRTHDNQNWPTLLSTIEAAGRYMPLEKAGVSPFEIMYRTQMRLPVDIILQQMDLSNEITAQVLLSKEVDLLHKIVRENLINQQEITKKQHEKIAVINHTFAEGQLVYMLDENVPDKHLNIYQGPFRIEKLKDNIALLRHHNTQKLNKSYVHVTKLKHDKSIARDRVLRRYNQNKTSVPDAQLPPSLPTLRAVQTPTADNGNSIMNKDRPIAPCTAAPPVAINAMESNDPLPPTSEQKQWLIRLRQSSEDLLKILTSFNK